jgi:hypothetical protein
MNRMYDTIAMMGGDDYRPAKRQSTGHGFGRISVIDSSAAIEFRTLNGTVMNLSLYHLGNPTHTRHHARQDDARPKDGPPMRRLQRAPLHIPRTASQTQLCAGCAMQRMREFLTGQCNERSFQTLELAFSGTGGLLSERQFLQRLQKFFDQPISKFARWIVDRQIVCFAWQGQTFVPSFQFVDDAPRMRLDVQSLVAELRPVLDDWELTAWFATPNHWLADRTPVDVLDTNIESVAQAARTERFVGHG